MSDFWFQNRTAMQDWDKNLLHVLDSSLDENYKILSASNGTPILKIKNPQGNWVDFEHSYDPIREAQDSIPKIDPGKIPLFVVMGMGSGLLLTETFKKYPDAYYIVFERDPKIFRKAFEAFDFSKMIQSNQVQFLVGLKPDYMYKIIYTAFMTYEFDLHLANSHVVKNDRLIRFSLEYYQQCADVFKKCVESYWDLYIGNAYQDAVKGLCHIVENEKYYNKCFSLEPYKGKFKSKLGIVVSSGPSLNRRLDLLKRIQNDVIIICADSALKKLLDNGIKPHGVACVERDDINAELFKGFEIPKDIALFAPPVLKPITFRDYPGPIGLIYRNAYPFHALPELLPTYHIGISCAHLAYFILAFLGCENIYLFGQDLAFDRESKASHFTGVITEASEQYANREKIPVDDNQGTTIHASSDWVMFRDIFGELIPYNQENFWNHSVFNFIESNSGLKIPFTKLVDPHSMDTPQDFMSSKDALCFDRCWNAGFEDLKIRIHSVGKSDQSFHAEVLTFLDDLKIKLNSLLNHTTGNAYREDFKKFLQTYPSKVRYLFEDLAKPHRRKFEASAIGVWDDQTFRNEFPQYLNLLHQIHSDLLNSWKGQVKNSQFYENYTTYPGFIEFEEK